MDFIITGALALLMFSVGLQIDFDKLKEHFIRPKALIVGLCIQIILLPITGYVIISLFDLNTEYALGVMLACAVPGGATSALITYWSGGDTALSINLTSINSFIITFISLPFILYISFETFLSENTSYTIKFLEVFLQLLLAIIFPVIIAILTKRYFHYFVEKSKRFFKVYMVAYYAIVIVAGIFLIFNESSNIDLQNDWKILLPSMFIMNLVLLILGYGASKMFNFKQEITKTIAIETAFQNNSLALALALSVIRIPKVGVPIMFYGIVMTLIGLVIVISSKRF